MALGASRTLKGAFEQLVSLPGFVLIALYAGALTLVLATFVPLGQAVVGRGDLPETELARRVVEWTEFPVLESLLPSIDASTQVLAGLLGVSLALVTYLTIVAVRAFLLGDRRRLPMAHVTGGVAWTFLNLVLGGVLVISLVSIGLGMVVVPGLVFLVSLVFTPVFIVDERENFLAAMRNSWRLSRGNRWSVFRMVIFTVAMASVVALAPRLARHFGLTSEVDPLLVDWLTILVLAPAILFVPAATVVAYKELREASDEFGVESGVDEGDEDEPSNEVKADGDESAHIDEAHEANADEAEPEEGSTSTMKAIVQDSYGPPDALRLASVDVPSPDDGEVLVRVHASSANPADWHIMRGKPYFMRLMLGLRRPKARSRGLDFAGRVETVGDDVAAFQPGDEVFGSLDWGDPGHAGGAFADYAIVPADILAAKPASISYEGTASLPLAGMTALQGLRQGGVGAGTRVLINGASGGIGTLAVQIAASRGAEVTGVCSTRNLDLVRSLGADTVVDYTEEDFTDREERYDCVIDWAGNRSLADLRSVLAPDGTLVLSSGEGGDWLGPMGMILKASLRNPFSSQDLGFLDADANASDLEELAALVDDGALEPVIDETYDLEDAPQAIRYLEKGHARGKVVIAVS